LQKRVEIWKRGCYNGAEKEEGGKAEHTEKGGKEYDAGKRSTRRCDTPERNKGGIDKTHRALCPGKIFKSRGAVLLRDDMSEFERSLILECREDGMGDDEIRAWLKEL